jgi:hypothetical protein
MEDELKYTIFNIGFTMGTLERLRDAYPDAVSGAYQKILSHIPNQEVLNYIEQSNKGTEDVSRT